MNSELKLEVLLSCMNQKDTRLVAQCHINTNVIIINQCDAEGYLDASVPGQKIRMVSTKERGLSRSRNMAILLAQEEICVLSDDDELFEDDYEQIILKSFTDYPDADIIAFDIKNKNTRLRKEVHRLGKLDSLKISSLQIAFRRGRILEKGIAFDIYMGAGSGNGCGEENKFLLDCLKAGLALYYVPRTIADVRPSDSTWFFGYDESFFEQRGAATRHMLGFLLSVLYGGYYLFAKRSIYRKDISFFGAFTSMAKGILRNPIARQKEKNG